MWGNSILKGHRYFKNLPFLERVIGVAVKLAASESFYLNSSSLKLHQVHSLCLYLQDLSNIFQYDLTTHLNESFCIRLIEYTCSGYVFWDQLGRRHLGLSHTLILFYRYELWISFWSIFIKFIKDSGRKFKRNEYLISVCESVRDLSWFTSTLSWFFSAKIAHITKIVG